MTIEDAKAAMRARSRVKAHGQTWKRITELILWFDEDAHKLTYSAMLLSERGFSVSRVRLDEISI